MKWLKRGGIFLTVWVLLALIGYGLALKDYSKKRFDQHQIANGAFVQVTERTGRISWADVDFTKTEIHLKVEGSDDVLTLKRNIIGNPNAWGVLNQFIRVGTKISTKVNEEDKTIVQLIINPGTVFQRNIFTSTQASENFQSAVTHNVTLGRWYIGIGLSGLFILIGIFLRKFKNRSGPSTRRGLYTN